MHDPTVIEQLRFRLAELGCPAKAVRRIVLETAEHYDDLREAALKRGLAPGEAAKEAAERLGDARTLAAQHVRVLRHSTWWGRHPVLGFGMMPLLIIPGAVILFWLLFAAIDWVISGWGTHGQWPETPAGAELVVSTLFGVHYAQIIALAVLFCWLARRTAVDFKWALIACALTSAFAFFYYMDTGFEPASSGHDAHVMLATGLFRWKNWAEFTSPASVLQNWAGLARAALPLLVAAMAYFRMKRAAAPLEPTPR